VIGAYIVNDHYIVKLLWMSLASFFLLHLAMGLIVGGIAPFAVRAAARMRAGSGARFLLAIRLFPCAFAVFAVAVLCVPSYLWLEPDAASEEIGFPCLAAAALCVTIWTISLARTARAAGISLRYFRGCRNAAQELDLPACPVTGWVIESSGHSIELAGIFRPRVVIGRDVLGVLSREQLDAAMRHEWAHATSRDNLKRLMILLAPDVLPFVRSRFADLDVAWARFAEWAADDSAAAGDERRSLSLAAALVAVARIGIPPRTSPLTTSPLVTSPLITPMVAHPGELSTRVNRLLDPRPVAQNWRRVPWFSAAAALAAVLVALGLGPSTLYAVHELLENWVR